MYKQKALAKVVAVTLVTGGLASPAFAADDSALLERIQLLEKQLLDLQQQVAEQNQQNRLLTTEIKAQQVQTSEMKSAVDKVASLDVKIGGYAKFDAMWSDYSDGNLPARSAGRQFYIPGTIPVGSANGNTAADFQAVESRINFSAARDVEGHKLSFFAEMDFMLSGQGDERISNSYSPRLRHFFFKYDNWLFGQTWSTFQDVTVLPDTLDFIGPSEGTIFIRQAQARYTYGNFEFALENPETTITPYQGGSRIAAEDSDIPDVVGRYNFRRDWGHLTFAGIYRDLAYNTPSGDQTNDTGYGASLSGKIKVFNSGDDVRFMLSSGKGLGRYIGLNTANGAVIDASEDLKAIDSTGGFLSYLHYWTPKWRSSLTYSRLDMDNDTNLTGEAVTENVWSVHANLLYSPTPQTTFGIEYLTAQRELESGDSGSMDRYIFSAKYAF